MMAEQDRQIADAIDREQPRLRNFIRRRVADREDAEDILQEVFYELVEAYRMVKPVEQVDSLVVSRGPQSHHRSFSPQTAGRVAMRQQQPSQRTETGWNWKKCFPPRCRGPEAAYARTVLLEELEAALDELPDEQREVFIAHEVMGQSFKELAAETGMSVNTLLSRKHYAVLHLRERLQAIHDEFTKS